MNSPPSTPDKDTSPKAADRIPCEPDISPQLDADRPYSVSASLRSRAGGLQQVCLKEYEGRHPKHLVPAVSDWSVGGDELLSIKQTTRAIAVVSRVEPCALNSRLLDFAVPDQLPDVLPRWLFARLVDHSDPDVRAWALRRPPSE